MADHGEQQQPQQGGLNLGFKIQGKARAKVAVNLKEQREDRQLITGVAGSVIQAAEPCASERRQHVIPRLENTYKTGVGKFVPTFVPESSSAPITGKADDKYEKAAKPDVPGLTSYGLQLRQPKGSLQEAAAGSAADTAGDAADDAATGPADAAAAAAAGPMVPVRRGDEAQQLREDLEALPDEASVEVSQAAHGCELVVPHRFSLRYDMWLGLNSSITAVPAATSSSSTRSCVASRLPL
jgi:hypothetical protein